MHKQLSSRLRVVCLGLLLAGGDASVCAQQSDPSPALALTNAAQVRNLPASQSRQALPVKMTALVLTQSDPYDRALILIDETGGIYVRSVQPILGRYNRGDVIEVEGVTDPGQFAPIILVSKARKIRTAPIPQPRPVTYHQLITGAMDAQWVELTGVVRRITPPETNSTTWRIQVASDGGIVSIRGQGALDAKVREDSVVRLQAICFYQFNQKRQVLTPVLQVPPGAKLEVIKPSPENLFESPVRPANSLLQFTPDTPIGHRVHVRGVVTHAQSGQFVWIRDSSSGLRIQARQQENLQAGDEIDALGFPIYGAGLPTLEDAVFKKTRSGKAPAPIVVTNAATAFEHEDDLIQLEAQLTEIHSVLEGVAMTFSFSNTVFKGILKLPPNQRLPDDWQPLSRVRVAGICGVAHDEASPLMGVWLPQSFQLLLRSPADLEITTPAPWWTPSRINNVFAIGFGSLLALTAIVVGLARKRINQQKRRRQMAEAEFAAILNERNRVAREIHDTLAQGLTATSVQLRLAKKKANDDPAARDHHIDAAQQLVRDSLTEARNTIWNMRSQVLEAGDLSAALESILKQMADGTEIKTRFEVKGRQRRFAPVIENNFLRIGQEAITNAARHAQARSIEVALDFGDRQLQLAVRDDGAGFDPASPPPSSGGFGLVGMKERAAELKGELHIRSKPGKGTEITLIAPLSSE
jgi:signal transduction histidine kinase